jgi:hypothetical protein
MRVATVPAVLSFSFFYFGWTFEKS